MPYDFTLRLVDGKHLDRDNRETIAIRDLNMLGRYRTDFGDMEAFINDIKLNGLIQPIVVDDDKTPPVLIAGGRRVRAYMVIPEANGRIPFTRRKDLSAIQIKELEINENMIRKNPNPLEQLEGLKQLDALKRLQFGDKGAANPEGWDIKQTAEMAELSPTEATRRLSLAKTLDARPDIKARVSTLPISAMHNVVANILKSEETQGRHERGELTLSATLVNSDLQSYLPTLAPNSVDTHIVDPPFGMDILEVLAENYDGGGAGGSQTQSYLGSMQPDDNLAWDAAASLMNVMFIEMYRTLKPDRYAWVFFHLDKLQDIVTMAQSAGFTVQWPVVLWDKGRPTTPFRGYCASPCYEAILLLSKGDKPRRLNKPFSALLRYGAVHAKKKIHIFEKPLDLLGFIIDTSTLFGETVCDCCAGSGATLHSATELGRNAVGCEKNKEHWLKAQARLAGVKKGGSNVITERVETKLA